jgi:hypothetical protein
MGTCRNSTCWRKKIETQINNDIGSIEMDARKTVYHWIKHSIFVPGLLCIIWFLLRTGTKPSRAIYPCQQAATTGGYLWLATFVLPLVSAIWPKRLRKCSRTKFIGGGIIILVTLSSIYGLYELSGTPPTQSIKVAQMNFTQRTAESAPASTIFVVNGTSGDDGGVTALLQLMEHHAMPFYSAQENRHSGLIGSNDVVIIKVNCQWDERGGTNTDLVKALVRAIVNHPDRFTGEIVIADNGQGQGGSTGRGGSLNYSRNNADDTSQSMQRVADSFAHDHHVSTYLWDSITTKRVDEYARGDLSSGYVVNTTPDPRTGLLVSYPKFTTAYGTYVSFKMGLWDPVNKTCDSDRLKVINVPVLKTHSAYGVTASVKHYMGVGSDRLTNELGHSSHDAVGNGGMGTEMIGTRFPTLNIIDAIRINAHPRQGPPTAYDQATQTNVIAASTDPVALDYWSAKNVLLPTAKLLGYSDLSSMSPDNTAPGSFGTWLRLSMDEIHRAGYQATMSETSMNVFIAQLH